MDEWKHETPHFLDTVVAEIPHTTSVIESALPLVITPPAPPATRIVYVRVPVQTRSNDITHNLRKIASSSAGIWISNNILVILVICVFVVILIYRYTRKKRMPARAAKPTKAHTENGENYNLVNDLYQYDKEQSLQLLMMSEQESD